MFVISGLKKSCDLCVCQTDSVLGLNESLKGPLSNCQDSITISFPLIPSLRPLSHSHAHCHLIINHRHLDLIISSPIYTCHEHSVIVWSCLHMTQTLCHTYLYTYLRSRSSQPVFILSSKEPLHHLLQEKERERLDYTPVKLSSDIQLTIYSPVSLYRSILQIKAFNLPFCLLRLCQTWQG